MNVLTNRPRFGVSESHERVRDIERNTESEQIKGEKMKLAQIREPSRQNVEREDNAGPFSFAACFLID